MDGERVGEAHPAFYNIITQLAPDEVRFVEELASRTDTVYIQKDELWITPTEDEIEEALGNEFHPEDMIYLKSTIFPFSCLNDNRLFTVFNDHLRHIGLLEFKNHHPPLDVIERARRNNKVGWNLYTVRLSPWGQLFHAACIRGIDGLARPS
jgi:hypothetical protein